jgi:membrane-bound lytic murein transglycosylase MltF
VRLSSIAIAFLLTCRCAAPEPAVPATPPAPEAVEIPVATGHVGEVSDVRSEGKVDLDAILRRGYLRVLVVPSRTHFDVQPGGARGRTVDAAESLAAAIGGGSATVTVDYVLTTADRLVPDLLDGRGDVAANVPVTFEFDEHVLFATPVRSGIREVVVTGAGERLVSLEDVGGRTIHVRDQSRHHASLLRLNRQLKAIARPPAKIVIAAARDDEELLERVNRGDIPATIIDDYIFERWRTKLPNAAINRDVAVSQDGEIAWATRKDSPQLLARLKDFFSTHRLSF